MMQLSNNIVHTGVTFSQANYIEYNNGNKTIFEDIIDDAIFDKYYEAKKVECDFIKTLPRSKKRIGLLKLAGTDNILWDKIRNIHASTDTKYNKVKSIIILLRDYVKTVDVAKKEHGEVLTPFNELAKPMVNLMDKYDDAFWGNPKNKVLDSSAGYGTFLILCLYKFMEGLSNYVDDNGSSIIEITKRGETKRYDLSIEDERLKYVIEQQLYYGELQSKSVFSWLVAIDIYDEHDANIYWGSYLEEGFDYHMKNVWEVEKFDLIIQNPPYQMQKDGNKKSQPLWHLLVQKSLKLLKEKGYMIMVHPSGWRNVDGVFKETQNLLKSKQILELNINSQEQGAKLFGAETRYDYYILNNIKSNDITNIVSQDNIEYKIDISNMDFIPNGDFDFIKSLMAFNDESVEIINNSSYHHQRNFMSKIETIENKYPCVYTVAKGDVPKLWWSNRNDRGHFSKTKLIWSNGRIISVGSIIDDNGIYAMTEFSSGLVDDIDTLPNIKKAFDSIKFRKTMELCSVSDMSINRKVIATFRKDFWKEFI